MSQKIHPTSIIEEGAVLGKGVEIGPFSVIGSEVEIGENCLIGNNVTITGKVKMGPENRVFCGGVIGTPPQDQGVNLDIPTSVEIGRGNIIREYVTIHRASEEGGTTRIGDFNMLMAFVHVAHDCVLGDEINIANMTALGGYVQVEDKVFLSGYCTFHQFVRVGEMAMVGLQSSITQDVPPFLLVAGQPATVHNVNAVGLKRNRVSPEGRKALRRAYKYLYRSGFNTAQALERINAELDYSPECMKLVSFIQNSRRGIIKKEAGEQNR